MWSFYTNLRKMLYIFPEIYHFPSASLFGDGFCIHPRIPCRYDSQSQCADVCRQGIYAASASVGFWLALILSCESCSEMRSIDKWQASLDNHAQNLKLSPNMGCTEPLEPNFVKGFFKRPGSQRNRYYAYIRCLDILNEGTELW